ncbi:hypothetical protein H072_3197 [Dactylellina haptotyla CBS 200.50]|uniref:Uncharacterized protein n=1 Tax=Dactylellina haptotyla (strain CBS 200.50) TaxID=1284197 RepID=S8AIG2_DACHA|nr:hypothetical protein H072_3197 [Dactylellina haptotyla CBS 200.50]
MKLSISFLASRPTSQFASAIKEPLNRTFTRRKPGSHANYKPSNHWENSGASQPSHGEQPILTTRNHQNRDHEGGGDPGHKSTKDGVLNLNILGVQRASITVYESPLLTVRYCSAILLLRTYGVLLNPFHPLLRSALKRHEETFDTGYFFHMHTSSKAVTGKQSSVRKYVRGKVRNAWETVLTRRGYDVKTGRFVKHLKPGWYPSAGDIRQQDVKGTISVNPNEACKQAAFEVVQKDCEKALQAVLDCKHRNRKVEHMMQPWNLWRYYDWKRRVLLKRYIDLGYGLSINGEEGWRFQDAVKALRQGEDPRIGGQKGEDGGYIVEMEGRTLDIAPLKRSTAATKTGFKLDGSLAIAEMVKDERLDTDIEDDIAVEQIYGKLGDNEMGISASGGLDWGLDNLGADEEDDEASKPGSRKGNPRNRSRNNGSANSVSYNDDF